jgi:DNA-binding transcriptional LysR family regulator
VDRPPAIRAGAVAISMAWLGAADFYGGFIGLVLAPVVAIARVAMQPAGTRDSRAPAAAGLIAVGSGPLLTRYRASTGTIKKGLPLIHVESTTDWSAWLESSGASLGDQRADILVSHAHIAVEAAVNGAGAALVHPALVARELKLGHLRRLSFQTLNVEQSYWIARPSKRKPTNQSRKIMNWLRSRATEERDWLDRHQHA